HNQLVPGSSPGGTTSKIKPSRKVEAFFIYKSHKKVISALYLVCRLPPVKPFKSSENVRKLRKVLKLFLFFFKLNP
ncbi:hypothetical protein N9P98_04045, partial [Flavobacteriaceae bacterium]|nr:hypothetical protein [Flavobacteriaceae bacterium]